MSEEESFKTSIPQDVCHSASEIREYNYNLNTNNVRNFEILENSIQVPMEENNMEIKHGDRKENNLLDTEKLYNCIYNLTKEVNEAKMNLEETKNGFKIIMFEMERQLEVANQREVKAHTKYLLLQMEKEKLMSLLDSKSNLILKLQKELMNAKRIIKFVNKRLRCFFHLPENASDFEYVEFESGFKNESSKLMSTKDTIDITNETTISQI